MQVSIDMRTIALVAGWLFTLGGFVWHAALLTATVRTLRARVDKLEVRLDGHDENGERLARLEQGMHDIRGILQQLLARSFSKHGAE